MCAAVNRRILLVNRPAGMPEETDFRLEEAPVPEPAEGQVLVRALYLSVDPYMRGRMSEGPSYIEPFALNAPLTGGVVGAVAASRHPAFREGEIVCGTLGWQDYSLSDGRGLSRVDPAAAPITTALGILGMPGLTAYFGLTDIGRPRAGETVLISAAAGAVGSAAGQIARIMGCRTVGTAGSPEKIGYLRNELGFDAAIDYNAAPRIDEALAEACPAGIDVYFDNVGGKLTDAAIMQLGLRARVVICGQIALYNLKRPAVGPRNLFMLIVRRARMEGFLVTDYEARYEEGLAQLRAWVREGRLRWREHIVEGLEQAPAAFLGLFRGENIGKQLVRIG